MATPPTLAPEIVIAVRDVCTRFGEAVVQDGVTLEVRRGKIFALAGPSGCGKSLLLRQALALQLPDSGSIRVLGRDVVGLRDEEALALTIFVVPRDPGPVGNAADRVPFLGAGPIVAAGTIGEVRTWDEPLVR